MGVSDIINLAHLYVGCVIQGNKEAGLKLVSPNYLYTVSANGIEMIM